MRRTTTPPSWLSTNLGHDERAIWWQIPDAAVWRRSGFLVVLAIALAGYLGWVEPEWWTSLPLWEANPTWRELAVGGVFLFLLLVAMGRIATRAFTAYAVTDRRLFRVTLMGDPNYDEYIIDKIQIDKVGKKSITLLERGSQRRLRIRTNDTMGLRAALKHAGVHAA